MSQQYPRTTKVFDASLTSARLKEIANSLGWRVAFYEPKPSDQMQVENKTYSFSYLSLRFKNAENGNEYGFRTFDLSERGCMLRFGEWLHQLLREDESWIRDAGIALHDALATDTRPRLGEWKDDERK